MKNIAYSLLILALAGCTSIETTPPVTQTISDEPGDVPVALVDLTGADVVYDPNRIVANIRVSDLPETLSYSKGSTPDNWLEYRWAIVFDIDGDGRVSAGDVELSVSHFKHPDSKEQSSSNWIRAFQSDLWLKTDGGGSKYLRGGLVEARRFPNQITITVNQAGFLYSDFGLEAGSQILASTTCFKDSMNVSDFARQ